MAFLELNNIHKGFDVNGHRTLVLRDVNLSVEEGQFVAIVGFSGSGKTTLISLIAGLMRPDRGQITLGGKPVAGPGADRALVFQNYSLLPWMSVFDNVHLAVARVFPDWTRAQKRRHVERYLDMVKLSAARGKRPPELSGGMRQRVALARALAMQSPILLMDEPLSALDALTRATLQDEIDQICRLERRTVVLITNDVDEGILLADRIIPLSAGPGATLGPAVEVDLARPRDRRALNHLPRFKEIRRQLIAYLMGSRRTAPAAPAADLHLPELVPADLTPRRRFALFGPAGSVEAGA